jgi:hypothetical protein
MSSTVTKEELAAVVERLKAVESALESVNEWAGAAVFHGTPMVELKDYAGFKLFLANRNTDRATKAVA